MSASWWELKHALRGLGRSPVSTVAILSTLGLGIGANLAVFSVVRATLIAPLPYERPDELVVVSWEGAGGKAVPLSPAELRDLALGTESFAGIAAYHPWTFNVTGIHPAERLPGAVATAELFEVLGVGAAIGRTFQPGASGASEEVLLSDGLWRRGFGADPAVLGAKLVLDGEPATVVGVMPRGFRYPATRQVELWRRAPYDPDQIPRSTRFLQGIARRAPGVPLATAKADVDSVAATLAAEHPELNEGMTGLLTPVRESVVRGFESNLYFLQTAVILALVLACFNVAILQLSRAEARRGEVAVRVAVGAGTGHVLRLSLWESLLLGAGGSALAALVALAGVPLLVRYGPANVHRLETAAVGAVELGIALIAGLGCFLIIGQAAFWAQTRRHAGLRLGQVASAAPTGRSRQVLVSVQIAVTVFLLLTFGLFLRSFHRLSSVDLGIDTRGVVVMGLMLPREYAALQRSSAFTQELRQRLEALPGVTAAATAVTPPLVGGMRISNEFGIVGRPADPRGARQIADIRPVSPGYFDLLAIPTVAGRSFDANDDWRAQPVAVVNRTLARHFFAAGDAVGHRFRTSLDFGASVGSLPHEEWEIIGVVGDVRPTGLLTEEGPTIYISTLQAPWMETQVLIKASVAPEALASRVQEVVHELKSDLPVLRPRLLDQALREALGPARFQSGMLGVFAGFALLLMMVGLYGTLAYGVARRAKEIGLRMALGARIWQTRWLVLRQGMAVVVAGSLVGVAAALLFGRVLSGLLFGVAPTDPVTYASVSALVVLTSLLASWLPARRATSIDPIKSLGAE